MRPGRSTIVVLALSGLLVMSSAFGQLNWRLQELPKDHAQKILGPQGGAFAGIAYDPEKEEGPHKNVSSEWWYHFGFLKEKGAEEWQYSFISSFQRAAMNVMFYTLTDLKTGERSHHGVLDKPPGWGDRPLPEGHKFTVAPDPPCEPAESEIWFCYGNNRIQRQGDLYKLSYENEDYTMDLTLERQGPVLPVNGNGMQGMIEQTDSYYYTYPRVSGEATIIRDGKKTELVGDFWYDHQWAFKRDRAKTPIRAVKWVWLGLKLDNGENLSLFYLAFSDTNEKFLWGLTRHFPDGRTEFYKDVTFTPKREWTSPRNRVYNVKWQIEVPEIGLVLDAEAYGDDHELANFAGGMMWEGPCKAKVSYKDAPKTEGLGFLEMMGHRVEGKKS